MGYSFNLKKDIMAKKNDPKDDAKAMIEEYIKGTPINQLAVKYNHTTEEVENVVTNVVPDKKGK